ncbi:tetratricopeptide repeat protein [Candidatus Magnetominusculus xianensis]|nr:tetratricopeptide repeat-containing response regulator [Candidatus Magnetominusculus xianensis]MBF0404188.1 tetratricopeptide repeat protein [Nitrospirota bacterium]
MMAKIDFTHKRILIIDDFSEYRRSVRKMFQALGAMDIDDTGSGDDAIEKIAGKPYDVILCDYNLGDGKRDGQQILEEIKHRDLLRYSTCFLMVTAENTMMMVMGAMEYKPDDYLTKPFTKNALLNRLERLLNRKSDFESVEKAIHRQDYIAALQACNERIEQKPKNMYEFMRIKADLSITLGNYSDAEQIYDAVIAIRRVPWALLGLGKVCFYTERFFEARDIFQELVDEHRSLMEAYDWLAKTLDELGETKEAQRVLTRAVEVSPKAILRQKALAQVAIKNKDLNTAEKSFRNAVDMGKLSCFREAADYTGLAKVLIEKKSPGKALELLEESKKLFEGEPEAALQSVVVQGLAYKTMGDENGLKKALNESAMLFESVRNYLSPEASLDMANSFFQLGEKDKASKIMQDVIKNNHDNEKLLKKAQSVFDEADMKDEGSRLIVETQQKIIAVNNEGVALVKNGKLQEAIEYFEKAAASAPENKIINANAAQAILMYMQKGGTTDKLIHKVKQYLERVRKVDPSYDKFHALIELFQTVVK